MRARMRLIVNADDFGRTPGINRGIIEAHRNGIVTSATLMVNQPSASEAARLARDHPHLGLGLHLTLCDGHPVAEGVPSLVDQSGTFVRDLAILKQRLDPNDVRREIRAQHERFLALVGHPPTHLDSHKHVHRWPGVLEPVIDLARQQGLPVRAPDGTTRAALVNAGIAVTDHFEPRFFGDTATVEDLITILRGLPEGTTELMCHPGYVDDLVSSYREPREAEISALRDPQVRAALVECGISLITFSEL